MSQPACFTHQVTAFPASAAAAAAAGEASVPFSPFQPNVSKQQPVFTFSLMSQPLLIPQYKVVPAAAADNVQTSWSNIGPFARYFPDRTTDPASGEGLRSPSADRQQEVKVMALTAVQLALGLVAPLGGCEGWQLHKQGVLVQYGQQVWAGRLEQLQQVPPQQLAASGILRVSGPGAAVCLCGLGRLPTPDMLAGGSYTAQAGSIAKGQGSIGQCLANWRYTQMRTSVSMYVQYVLIDTIIHFLYSNMCACHCT
jgi:hypothetical protein